MAVDLNLSIDRRSSVPLYEQICQQIRGKIENGELELGATLPTNLEFCEMLQVSHKTAQEAMAQLAREGFVSRQARRGTVVKGVPVRGVVGIYSWVELLDSNTEHEYYRLVTNQLSRQLERSGRVYRMYLGTESLDTPNTAFDDLRSHLSAGGLCGAVLVTPTPRLDEMVRLGREMKVPVLAMFGGQSLDYSVRVDYPAFIQTAARWMSDRNRYRVGVIYNRDSFTLHEPGLIGELLQAGGIDPGSARLLAGETTIAGGYEAARALPLDQLDGLLVTDDVMASGVDRWLMEQGRDRLKHIACAVLSLSGSRTQWQWPFEQFAFDIEKQVALMLNLMQDVIRGRRIDTPHLTVVPYHVGQLQAEGTINSASVPV